MKTRNALLAIIIYFSTIISASACSIPSQGEKILDNVRYSIVDITELRRCNNVYNAVLENGFDSWMNGHRVFIVARVDPNSRLARDYKELRLEEGGDDSAWGRAIAPYLRAEIAGVRVNPLRRISNIEKCDRDKCGVEVYATLKKGSTGEWYLQLEKGEFNGDEYSLAGEFFRGWIGTMENLATFWNPW